MEDDKNQQSFVNDAFTSYSRKDKEFAACLEKALKNYKSSNGLDLPQHNLFVFRDEKDFTGVNITSLETNLKNSRKVKEICSAEPQPSSYH